MIIDCFPFFNELDLLEIRLNELKDVVDVFVLCEATHTFSGKPKRLYYNAAKDRFSDFNIIHRIYNNPPQEGETAWDRERDQRNALLDYLPSGNDSDILLLSDVDEVPKSSLIRHLSKLDAYRDGLLFGIHMNTYVFCFNYLASSMDWIGTKFINRAMFNERCESFQNMRDLPSDVHIYNGGWHFTYFGDAHAVQQKLQSYAHTENANLSLDFIQNAIDNRHGLVYNKEEFTLVNIDATFPKHLLENRKKFAHLSYRGEKD